MFARPGHLGRGEKVAAEAVRARVAENMIAGLPDCLGSLLFLLFRARAEGRCGCGSALFIPPGARRAVPLTANCSTNMPSGPRRAVRVTARLAAATSSRAQVGMLRDAALLEGGAFAPLRAAVAAMI